MHHCVIKKLSGVFYLPIIQKIYLYFFYNTYLKRPSEYVKFVKISSTERFIAYLGKNFVKIPSDCSYDAIFDFTYTNLISINRCSTCFVRYKHRYITPHLFSYSRKTLSDEGVLLHYQERQRILEGEI